YVAVVLPADELDKVFVFREPPVDADCPGLRVGFRIVDGDIEFDAPVRRAAEFLGDLCAAREGRAIDVEPSIVPPPNGLDDKRIAFVLADRTAVPPRLRIVHRQRTPIGKDVAKPAVRLVHDDQVVRGLNYLSRLRMRMELHKSEW